MIWSVPHLLDPNSDKKPTQTLEHHQAEITGIVCGKGTGPANIIITASKDSSVLVSSQDSFEICMFRADSY